MRVGYVLRYYPALSETFVAREIEGMMARGVQVDVAALGARASAAEAWAPAAPVWSAPRGWRRSWPTRASDVLLWRWQRWKDVGRASWLRRLAARRRWDRVHVHFAGEALELAVAAQLGLPLSVTVHASDLFVPRPSLATTLRAAAVVTVCDHHRRWLMDRYGVPATVVRCGVPTDVPQAAPGGPGFRVITVARDVPKKDLDGLVASLPPGVELRLVADAPRLRRPGVHVGPLPPAEVRAALASAQLFVLPCRVAPNGDRDGVPVALMEAMAAGLPVVSTDVSGVPELVDASVGWVVPAGDRPALRRAIEVARDDPDERVARGLAGRARVREGWTIDQQVDGLLAVWRR